MVKIVGALCAWCVRCGESYVFMNLLGSAMLQHGKKEVIYVEQRIVEGFS